MKRQLAAQSSASQYRVFLYATSLLLLAVLVYLGLQLRARAMALRRRAAFEHLIAGISMRFINVQPQHIDAEIERALADMARCLGSDRAYFVMGGTRPRLHLWCEAGTRFPPGWPERAPPLAARLAPLIAGMIHGPRVNPIPIG